MFYANGLIEEWGAEIVTFTSDNAYKNITIQIPITTVETIICCSSYIYFRAGYTRGEISGALIDSKTLQFHGGAENRDSTAPVYWRIIGR